MANFESYNNSSFERIEWGFDMADIPFVEKAKLLMGHTYKVRALYISANHGYGIGAVVVIDQMRINLPMHLVDKVKAILNGDDREENIRAIKNGEMGIEFYQYDTQTRKNCIGANFKNFK